MVVADLAWSFVLGLLTPITAVCVLPLYPGFLAYLANQTGDDGLGTYGLLTAAGVVLFMLTIGLLFTTILQVSLTTVVETVSPIAFLLLAAVSIMLILDIDLTTVLPHLEAPRFQNPRLNALAFGFFFGAIVIPCNPGFIAAFFARSLLLSSPLLNAGNVLMFGLGIAAPLLFLATIPQEQARHLTTVLTRHKTWINRGAGTVMLAVALYYLIFVFHVVPGV